MATTDLHQHFKVEYDKANVISAYPSFLPEEIDIWLNKAYLMLLSQKMTGNNYRRVAFEGDVKRISDLQQLVTIGTITTHENASFVKNAIQFDLSTITDFLYYIVSTIKLNEDISEVILTSHEVAQKVKETGINKPWIPRPVAEIDSNTITIYYDTIKHTTIPDDTTLSITYIKQPAKIDFVKAPTAEFELSDSVAYELVSLAVMLALENIESQRMESKGSTLIMQE